MSQAFVIEVNTGPAGIVVRDGNVFRFFASSRDFDHLEGQQFRSPRQAEQAARQRASELGFGHRHRRA